MKTRSELPTPQDTPAQPSKKKPFPLIYIAVGAALVLVAIICLNGIIFIALRQTKDDIVPLVQGIMASGAMVTGSAASNQIVYVGNDNNLWLVSPDGKSHQSLTDDASASRGYQFPTWSPDGRHIAFIGPEETGNFALYVTPPNSGNSKILYNSPNSAPFYLYWLPNSQGISFLTQELSGLAMRQVSLFDADDSRLVGEGSPFYWSWSPMSDRLFMHVGGARLFSEQAHLSVIENRADAGRVELKLAPGRFQAPVWSADGQHVFYIAENDSGDDAIFKMEMTTLEQIHVADLDGLGQTFMVVSPDGQQIAYMETSVNQPVPLGIPGLVGVNGQDKRTITRRPVMSMYWSPDGKKLALLTAGLDNEEPSAKVDGLAAPPEQGVVFRWWVYDVETEALEPLTSINPTLEFMQTVPYFDQYHLSLTFWSPDSRYFVATTEVPDTQGEAAVLVLDTAGQESPRQIGEGTLAIWSWK